MAIPEKYRGNFSNRDEVAEQFECGSGRWTTGGFQIAPDFPTDEEILFAEYETPSYEGYAFVLYQRDGKLYEVSGSHCSCYGLEGQWSPEETSWAALAIRQAGSYGCPAAVVEEAKRQIQQPS